MSAVDQERRDSELRRQLMSAAQDEIPPETSLAQALELIDTASFDAPAGAGKRFWLWALPAAAALLGLSLLIILSTPRTGESPAALPPVTSQPAIPSTPTLTVKKLAARPAAAPTPSTSASSAATSSAIARRPPDGPPATTLKPPAAPPPKAGAACPCAPSDLMCQMQKCTK